MRRLGMLLLVAAVAVVAWHWRQAELPTRAASAPAVKAAARSSAPGAGTLRTQSQNPTAAAAATQPPAPRTLVFGENGPVRLDDIPVGRFRRELLRLPPALQESVLRRLGDTAVPVLDLGSLHVDAYGLLFYACEFRLEEAAAEPGFHEQPPPPVFAAAPVPISSPPVRHSRPGAGKVIFLNFSGTRISNTLWNQQRSTAEFVCVPYNRDGDATTFSAAEQAELIDIWERVAEDYRPFDVDVTTERPAVFTAQTLEAVITKSVGEDEATPNPGAEVGSVLGIAYLDVFGTTSNPSARPCFIYYDRFPSARTVANTVAHELGHNLSLRHDGRVIPDQQISEEYYLGHGTGEMSWRPIMGSGFTRQISQWSKGEYYGANNSEDDLARIAARLGYAPDDHADTAGAATPLVIDGPRVTGSGVIGNTEEADRFRFTTGAGAMQLTVRPFFTSAGENAANLDVALELFDSAGNLLASADPPSTMTAQLTATLAAGTYVLRVRGTGIGSPLATPPTGYTRYGSLGAYTIDGFVPAADGQLAAPFVSVAPRNTTASDQGTTQFSVEALGNPAPTLRWQRQMSGGATWSDLADDGTFAGTRTGTLMIARVASAMNGDQFRCVASNSAGSLTSAVAALKVLSGRLAITPPSPVGVVSSALTLSLLVGTAPADAALVCQWLKDGVEIPGATSPSLVLPYLEDSDAGVYAVRVDDSLTSDPVTLAVTSTRGMPAITSHPAGNLGLVEDEEVDLRVSVASATPVSYQWRKDGVDISGATSATLTLPHVSLNDNGTYTVRVANSVGAVVSKPALLQTGFRRPELISFPADQVAGVGETVTLAVEFRSTTPLQYQWYKYQANAAGIYDRPIPGATGPTLTLTNITAADDGLYTVRVGSIGYGTIGSTYISNYARSSSRAKLTVITPWVFVEEPASQVARAGDTVFLRVSLYSPDGTASLYPTSMQWQKDGVDLAGETGALLTLPNVQASAQGAYTMRVTNRGGTVVSHPAMVAVTAVGAPFAAPTITSPPVATSVAPGGNTAFFAGVASVGVFTFQWQKDGVDLPGRTTAILGLYNVQASDAGAYSVAVTNSAGTTRSAPVTLAVGSPTLATIVTPPASQTASIGSDATLSVTVSSATPVTYQWQIAGALPTPILGATGPTLRLSNVRTDFQGDYQVVVFNSGGAAFSSIARLTVTNPVPALTIDDYGAIAYRAVLPGESTSFYVSAVSASPVSYQWRKDGADLPGQTAASISFPSVQLAQQGVYTARVSNAGGTVLSRPFNLWVFPPVPPEIVTSPASRAASVGDALSLAVVARSDHPLTYQWRKNGQDITDAQGAVLAISNAQPLDSGTYTVRVSNRSGTVVTVPATLIVGPASAVPPAILTAPASQMPGAGQVATLTVDAVTLAGNPPLSYRWQRNGSAVVGATGAALSLPGMQPIDTGVYTVSVTSGGTNTSTPAILGIVTAAKLLGTGMEVGSDIKHANGNTYDQILLQGPAVAVTADAGQVLRLSFVDLTGDIVQVEFSGSGTLALALDAASGPAPAANYHQPGVSYMKGLAGIVISGADETTNLSVFSVGRVTALDPTLFRDDVAYDGAADLAFIAISSVDGKFGGVRAANATFYAAQGLTGIYAPGVRFTGPVYVGDISASDAATPVLVLGAGNDVRVTGGNLLQANGRAVQIAGIGQLRFTAGSTSHGGSLPAQLNRARFEQNGVDVTAQIVANPGN